MNGSESAKQFLPYAALKGYDSAVHESDISYCDIRLWGQDRAEELDEQLRGVIKGDFIKAVWYREGLESCVSGRVAEIDLFGCSLIIGREIIPFDCIYSIEKL